MKDYTYTFDEKSSGSITIRSNGEPNREEIIRGIENGDGIFVASEYLNIQLASEESAA